MVSSGSKFGIRNVETAFPLSLVASRAAVRHAHGQPAKLRPLLCSNNASGALMPVRSTLRPLLCSSNASSALLPVRSTLSRIVARKPAKNAQLVFENEGIGLNSLTHV